jgi:hypothetical protein
VLGRVRTLVSGEEPLARGAEGVREPDTGPRLVQDATPRATPTGPVLLSPP